MAESKVEAVLAGKKGSFVSADDADDKDASSSASPAAAIFAFMAPPLSLLRHVAGLCAGYLGFDVGVKPSAPAPAPVSSSSPVPVSSSSSAAAYEDCTEVVLEVRSRGGFMPPQRSSITPRESRAGAVGGWHH